MPHWTNILDSAPEPGKIVLITDGKEVLTGYIGCGGYSGPSDPRQGWMCIGILHFIEDFFPTHWMPLPEPPE